MPVCQVCKCTDYRYTCPRCQVLYCSLQCYKKHSSGCTESFYQNEVEEALRAERVSPEEKAKLEKALYLLNHPEEGDESDSEGEVGEAGEEETEGGDGDGSMNATRLAELTSLAEAGHLGLHHLSESEMQQFFSAVKRGVLSPHLPKYEPWWTDVCLGEVKKETAKQESKGEGEERELPLSFQDSSHICCSGSRRVHESVRFSVLECLFAYAHSMRTFQGGPGRGPSVFECDSPSSALSSDKETVGEATEFVLHFLHLAPVLHSRQAPVESLPLVISGLLGRAKTISGVQKQEKGGEGGGGNRFSLLCLRDVADLMAHSSRSLRALRHIRALVEFADTAPSTHGSAGGEEGASGRLGARGRFVIRKLAFFESFTRFHFMGGLAALPSVVCTAVDVRMAEEGGDDGGAEESDLKFKFLQGHPDGGAMGSFRAIPDRKASYAPGPPYNKISRESIEMTP